MTVFRPSIATCQDITKFHDEDYIKFLQKINPLNIPNFSKHLNRFNVGNDCPVFDGTSYSSLFVSILTMIFMMFRNVRVLCQIHWSLPGCCQEADLWRLWCRHQLVWRSSSCQEVWGKWVLLCQWYCHWSVFNFTVVTKAILFWYFQQLTNF